MLQVPHRFLFMVTLLYVPSVVQAVFLAIHLSYVPWGPPYVCGLQMSLKTLAEYFPCLCQ